MEIRDGWKRSKMCPDYMIGPNGEVKQIDTSETVYPNTNGSSLYVTLKHKGRSKKYKLADVVADAYQDIDHTGMRTRHKNKNRQDNRPENIEWIPKNISYRDTKIQCVETGEIYYNAYACSEDLGVTIADISFSVVERMSVYCKKTKKRYTFIRID